MGRPWKARGGVRGPRAQFGGASDVRAARAPCGHAACWRERGCGVRHVRETKCRRLGANTTDLKVS